MAEEEVPLEPSNEEKDFKEEETKNPKLYKRRWLMITIFSFDTMVNSMGWITYGSVALFSMDLFEIGSLEGIHFFFLPN